METFISFTALILSTIALCWNIITEKARSKANLKARRLMTFRSGTDDDRPEMHLLLKNPSHRPTGIYVFQIMRNEIVIGGNGYRNRITLPFRLGPWDVERHSFRMEENDFQEMTHLLLIDIDENRVEIPKNEPIWFKFKKVAS
ncbi:MAG: hypothetical protein ACW990_17280 [Promethearchaeota archaeon]|jgi:phage portal protein BeeE